jgi:hypothetical protein
MPLTYILIEAKTLSSEQSSIEFTSIPSIYTDLIFRFNFQGSTAGSRDDIKITLNGDTASNYYATRIFVIDGANSASQTTSGTPSDINLGAMSGQSSNSWSHMNFYIANYSSTTIGKGISCDWGVPINSADAGMSGFTKMWWNNTAALSSFKIESKVGGRNIVAGSKTYLYGIKNS